MKKHSNHLSPRFWPLLALFVVWPGSVALSQQSARPQPARSRAAHRAVSYAFVSPNTREDLTLATAIAALNSPDEQRLIEEARQVTCRLRLSLFVQKALGSWTDGAENSVLLRVKADVASLRYAGSWLGKFAHQKALLYFHPGSSGRARMYVLLITRQSRQLGALAAELDADGVANRTIVPRQRQLAIYVVDLQNALKTKVHVAAQRLHARLSIFRGSGIFIGAEDRDKAQAIFEEEIKKYESSQCLRDCRKRAQR
jgi:hypothetical protein